MGFSSELKIYYEDGSELQFDLFRLDAVNEHQGYTVEQVMTADCSLM